MRARIGVAISFACVLGAAPAWAVCPNGKLRTCVIDLNALSQISQQIAASEKISAPPKALPPDQPQKYTGPTIGTAPNLGRAPEVGYRWAIN